MSIADDTLVCYEINAKSNPLSNSQYIIDMVNGCITTQTIPIRTNNLHIITGDRVFTINLREHSDIIRVCSESKTRVLWPFMDVECYDYFIIEHVKYSQTNKYGRSISDYEAYMLYDLMYYKIKTHQLSMYSDSEHIAARNRYEYQMDAAIIRVHWVHNLIEDFWVKYCNSECNVK